MGNADTTFTPPPVDNTGLDLDFWQWRVPTLDGDETRLFYPVEPDGEENQGIFVTETDARETREVWINDDVNDGVIETREEHEANAWVLVHYTGEIVT